MGGKGSGGHNRKSNDLHILEGTYRRDRHDPIWGSKRAAKQAPGKDIGVLSYTSGWLVFFLGPCANTGLCHEPFFKSIEDMKEYYFENKSRVVDAMGSDTDFWAYHAFEKHDRASCEYCKRYDIEN